MIEHQLDPELGHPFANKKKRSVLFLVVAVSILVHVIGLGTLAVIVIVDTVVKEPPAFEAVTEALNDELPPPPPPPTQKSTQRSMPRPQPLAAKNPLDLSIPQIEIKSGEITTGLTGRGLGGGLGEVGGGMADSIRITGFGFDQMMEGTLTGTLYDLKRDPEGNPISGFKRVENESYDTVERYAGGIIKKFIGGWNKSFFDRTYYRADKRLYASYFIIPNQSASAVPAAFGVQRDVQPRMVVVAYEGKFTARDTGQFRFYGKGDDVLIVRLNGRIVFDGSFRDLYTSHARNASAKRDDTGEVLYGMNNYEERGQAIHGNWFNLREGESYDMEVLIGEIPGGEFAAWLCIEKRDDPEGPKVFSTRPLSEQDKRFLMGTHPDTRKFLK